MSDRLSEAGGSAATGVEGLVRLDALGARDGGQISELLRLAWSMLPRGGTIVVPPGEFVISETVEFVGRPLRLVGRAVGDGRNGSLLRIRTGGADGIRFKRQRGLLIADLLIQGADMQPGSFLLSFSEGIYNASIERCLIERGANGLHVRGANRLRIVASTLRDFDDHHAVLLNGVGDDGANHAVEFMNSTIAANNLHVDNIVQDGAGGSTKLIGCYVGKGRHGFWQHNSTGGRDPNFLYVTAGGFENGSGDCIRLECGQKAMIGGGAYLSSSGWGDGLALRGSFTSCVVSGAYIRGNGRHGILHQSGSLVVGASQIFNNGSAARQARALQPSRVERDERGAVRLVFAPAPAFEWEAGDRVRVRLAGRTAKAHRTVEVRPVPSSGNETVIALLSTAHEADAAFMAAIDVNSLVMRLGQGVRSERRAGPARIGSSLIGAEAGGPNLQEHPVLSDNPRLVLDRDHTQQTVVVVISAGQGGSFRAGDTPVMSRHFLERGRWRLSRVVGSVDRGNCTITLSAGRVGLTDAITIGMLPTSHDLDATPAGRSTRDGAGTGVIDATGMPVQVRILVHTAAEAAGLAVDATFTQVDVPYAGGSVASAGYDRNIQIDTGPAHRKRAPVVRLSERRA